MLIIIKYVTVIKFKVMLLYQIYEQQILMETEKQTLSRTKVRHTKLEEYHNCQNVHISQDDDHEEVEIIDKVELAMLPYRVDIVFLMNV